MMFAVIALLAASVLATPLPYTSCGDGHVTVTSVDATPFPPQAGSVITVVASGTVDKVITEGTFDIRMKLGQIPVYHKTGDLCTLSTNFTCPHSAGPMTIQQDFQLPHQLPSGKVHVTISATDSEGLLLCFESEIDMSVEIKDNFKIIELSENYNFGPLQFADEFHKFIRKFKKTYHAHEHMLHRFSVFSKNLLKIYKHNSEKHSWTMAVNEFADLTWEEFRDTKLGLSNIPRSPVKAGVNLYGMINVPDEVDWVAKGMVTDMKDQGHCGSCWTFSTTGSMESAVAIKTGRLTSLSEQQLVDCASTPQYGNRGCHGGLMDKAFNYILDNGGLCSEEDYPYTATEGTCQTSCSIVSTISSYKDVASESESALLSALSIQPVSIAVQADHEGFHFYSGGVFDGECGSNLNHAVLAVGYGTKDGKDYFKVKNSWGTTWGEDGYIYLSRNGDGPGQCGINLAASYPIA